MSTANKKMSAHRHFSFFAIPMWIGVLTFAGSFQSSDAQTPAVELPRVTSVTQVTHDGFSKTSLLSDDSFLYVTEWQAGHRVISKVPVEGVGQSTLPSTFSNLQGLDLSPDRTRILISGVNGSSSDELWALPLVAGTPERIGSLAGHDASWSADSREVVFAQGNTLFQASSIGTQSHELFTASGSVFAPHFSPDGQRIRFSVSDPAHNTTSLWEIGRNSSNPHALLTSWQNGSVACCGSWTADGRYYIFQITQTATTALTTLWALPESSRSTDQAATPIQLTAGPTSFGNAWLSRDSKKLWTIGVAPAGEIVKYVPDTKNFVPVLSGVSATDLNFSPDGKWVTYVSIPDGTLWRSRADGAKKLQLTFAPERAALPHWSPDGKQIAYVRIQPGKPWKISVIPAAGGNPKEILPENRSQVDASWSADGTRIMFGYFLHDPNGLDIRVVDVKTHKSVTVPGSDGLFSPRWSPNGRYVAALSPDFTTVKLFDFETQKWSDWLTEPAGSVSYPVWSADSNYLYFDDLVTDEEWIRRIKVGENHPERIFAVDGIERYSGPLGLWSGQTADGSWMFVRDSSTQEIYQLGIELPRQEGK